MRFCLPILIGIALTRVASAETVDYTTQVKPILVARCYACHAALEQRAGLRVDTVAAMLRGGESGPAVDSAAAAKSLLLERITTSDLDLRMPPEGEGAPLTAPEIAKLKAWIEAGALAPANDQPEADPRDHWSFRAPQRAAVPVVKQRDAVANPIDSFLVAAQEARGLAQQSPAEKRLLLRRVYLDLLGLPPSAEQLQAFAEDPAPDSYERVVDELLARPQYGERWGRHWMDVWRYSDWWGLGAEVRNSQKHIWHWRDWIVESLNEDVGYDEMVRQMLAADELYPNDLQKLRGSGFLARQYFKFNRNSWMEETIEHTSKAFLGLTFNCARCHDHKYDPISQRDYYRLRAFFEPYQVRTEQLPGQIDYELDGLPRAFDCNLATPTYLFRRGDDQRPVTEEPLPPGLPGVLSFEELKIEPITLPAEAQQPGLRELVVTNQLQRANREIAAARLALETAQATMRKVERLTQLSAASSPDSVSTESALLVSDDFATERPELWTADAGEWKYVDGKLTQQASGDLRGVMKLSREPPEDFQVRVKFTATGGKMWKSVGLAFDLAGEQDTLVYLSCVTGGSKAQIAFKQNGAYVYPSDSQQIRTIQLGEPQDVTIRVRGPLVNVEINGEHAIAYRLPIERHKGTLALITYDAQAEFRSFELSRLSPGYAMKSPAGSPPAGAINMAVAQATLKLAEQTLAVAEREPGLVQARAAADRARYASPVVADAPALIRAAAAAERQSELAKAEMLVAQRELEVAKADPAKLPELEKLVATAREAAVKAKGAIEQPGESYTSLSGALKTLESNVESAEHRNLPFPATSTGRRTALAAWITDRRNPTAARVAVNHLWLRHMGTPLVPTVFDLGRKGTPPLHRELLDWLAVELIESGWSMKHVHRLIVTSNTYRLSGSVEGYAASQTQDPENRYYWRRNAVRLESQAIRDSLLALAGELDLAAGGPSIPQAEADRSLRRSLYFVHSHNEHSKLLATFDDASVLDCYRRDQSIVPQQALALSNSKLSFEAAEKIARRLAGEKVDNAKFIGDTFNVLLATEPNAAERQACDEALHAWQQQGLTPQRARTNLVQALLNHNDFVTVR